MNKINKRCPRCDMKMPVQAKICPGCGLNYDKFDMATNRAGKLAVKEGRKDDIVMRKGCPADVNKTKLLLITIFLGFTGAHNYYVGRYGRGIFFTVFFLFGLANAVLTTIFKTAITGMFYEVLTILALIWGAVLLTWMFDIVNVVFNKYRIPVSLDIN